jgi:hypothetical protein
MFDEGVPTDQMKAGEQLSRTGVILPVQLPAEKSL